MFFHVCTRVQSGLSTGPCLVLVCLVDFLLALFSFFFLIIVVSFLSCHFSPAAWSHSSGLCSLCTIFSAPPRDTHSSIIFRSDDFTSPPERTFGSPRRRKGRAADVSTPQAALDLCGGQRPKAPVGRQTCQKADTMYRIWNSLLLFDKRRNTFCVCVCLKVQSSVYTFYR